MKEIIEKIMLSFPTIFLLAVIVLIVLIIVLFIIGFIQNREISFWPPKIGSKPSSIKKESCELRSQNNESISLQAKDRSSNNSVLMTSNKIDSLKKNIERKLIEISNNDATTCVLIGSTYLDIIVNPISVTSLTPEEWSDLHPLKVTIGGSAMCVGRYLSIDYGIKSYLFTQVSNAKDIFSKEFRKLLEIEQKNWINDTSARKSKSSESAPVTLLLKQLNQSYTTMFTHKGALVDFSWADIKDELNQVTKEGSVIYLSGFLKSQLSLDIVNNLKHKHDKNLICIDHGRLNIRTDNYSVLTPLYDAFTSGIIDVYICTLSEILDFFKIVTGKNYSNPSKDSFDILKEIAISETLPPITIVRNTVGEKSISAFSIVGGVVDPVPDHSKRYFDNTPVAPLNAFNATIIEYFLAKKFDTTKNLRGHTIEACQKALEACHKKRENDPSTV